MLCPNQGCETEMIPTIEKLSQRINIQLIRIGFWECPKCKFVKGIFQKNFEQEDKIVRSVKCHCCNDTGQIHHYLIQKYIFPEYLLNDPPVPCKRCRKGTKISYGWDIGTREECDRIHRLQLGKALETVSEELQIEIQQKIAALSQSKSVKKFDEDEPT